MTARTMPVELLRDRRGVYGIGVSDAYDFEALAWACGVDDVSTQRAPRCLILRADMFHMRHGCSSAVLQKIIGGFRHGMFSHFCEEHLRQFIHHEALMRAGLPWPPEDERWWSSKKALQDRNRQIYHGLRLSSLHIINKLIGAALQEAADQDALKVARRFPFRHREALYRAGARSHRALQLAEVFPVLALAIYAGKAACWDEHQSVDFNFDAIEQSKKRAQETATLIERGARLRDVAAVMQIPMALRRVKPGAAHLAHPCHNAEWVTSLMPDALPQMRIWLRAVDYAYRHGGPNFAEWTAAHVLQIPGRESQIAAFLSDIKDWVQASRSGGENPFGGEGGNGHQFITRPFHSTMSLRTVSKLSDEWHEAVASNMSGPQYAFPVPWLPAATINGVDIVPIDNSADLYREGALMHHCAGTYVPDVRAGTYCVYSVRRDGERVATAALIRNGSRAQLQQLRGPCNAEVPKEIGLAVSRWLRMQTGPLPEIAHRAYHPEEELPELPF
jgi:PcfJ-like protein